MLWGRDETRNDQAILAVRKQLPFFSSRATRAEFGLLLKKMGAQGPLGGTAVRKLMQDCFGDASLDNITSPDKKARLQRLTDALKDGGEDIVLDLRLLNFRVDDPKFDKFWGWCATETLLEGATTVDSRRGDGLRMSPMAKYPSAPSLMLAAKTELGTTVDLPTLSWFYYQFHPGVPLPPFPSLPFPGCPQLAYIEPCQCQGAPS